MAYVSEVFDHQRPPETENPGGWGGGGVQIKESSLGGYEIFWNHMVNHFMVKKNENLP